LRERNEDSFLVQHWTWANQDRFDELALVVVADGMGGHRAGAHASGLVVRTVALTLAPLLSGVWKSESRSWTINHLESDLIQAILEANRAVHGQAQRDPECEGMGATAVAALVWNNRAVICHVGDTRVYHRRGSEFVQVTRDQTLVARMIELGQLAPEEADTHPARHEVLQALGRREDLEPAAYTLQLAPHDWLIVASDGLHADLEAGAIQNAFQSANPSAGWIAHHLVKAAEEAGGSDNCTVVAIRRQGG
jgi:protein phosphatase